MRLIFELIQIEVQCSKNYFKISLSQVAGASRNNTEKEPQSHTQNWRKQILNIYREYLLYLQSNVSGCFLQTCNKFVEQQLKLSQF